MKKFRLGLFGGTFDPIHNGHLIVAERIIAIFDLKFVDLIPSFIPPHKVTYPHSDIHRENMVAHAIENNPKLFLSPCEIDRGTVSYTVDTIKYFNKTYCNNAKIFFIIGADAFLGIHTWEKSEDLLNLCKFIVVNRGFGNYTAMENYCSKLLVGKYSNLKLQFITHDNNYDFKGDIFYVNLESIGISSSQIRKLAQCGKSIRYMTPDKVIKYITDQNLYKSENMEV